MRGGLPFSVEIPRYKQEVIAAMEETKQISRDPDTKRYGSFAEAYVPEEITERSICINDDIGEVLKQVIR